MRLLNLTPHAIVILNIEGEEIVSFPASGEVVRLKTSSKEVGVKHFDNEFIAVVSNTVEGFVGLPPVSSIIDERYDGILVSSMVLDALPSQYRNVAFAPDTGSTAVRNDKGHIVGVTQLRTI